MIEKFLTAKHWQLFLLFTGIPMIMQFVLMDTLLSVAAEDSPPEPEKIISIFKFFPLVMLLVTGIFFGWFWSIAIGLGEKIPPELKMKTGLFKFFLIVPALYLIGIMIFVGTMISGMINSAANFNPAILGIIVPLHLFSMFCIIYCLYFVAKTIKLAELQRPLRTSEFAGEFFLIWFFPVGIWFVQPKINELFTEHDDLV